MGISGGGVVMIVGARFWVMLVSDGDKKREFSGMGNRHPHQVWGPAHWATGACIARHEALLATLRQCTLDRAP